MKLPTQQPLTVTRVRSCTSPAGFYTIAGVPGRLSPITHPERREREGRTGSLGFIDANCYI